MSKSTARCLIDTGASGTHYISKAFCNQIGLTFETQEPESVTMADGSSIRIVGTVTVPIHIQSYRAKLPCYVMDMTPEYDIVLGDRWLIQNHAVIDYGGQTCSLQQGNRCLVLQTNPVARTENQNVSKILNPMQVKRNVRKGNKTFFVMVRSLDCEGPQPDADSDAGPPPPPNPVCPRTTQYQDEPLRLKELLDEYPDVCPDSIPGLPPDRGAEISIPL